MAPEEPDAGNGWLAVQAERLQSEYRRLTRRSLLAHRGTREERAQALYEAPFVVLAHDNQSDPCFSYANRRAQALFEMPWEALVGMPSRLSAEPMAQAEREVLLQRVSGHGYIDDYSGVRIARSGRRFRIERATVWNLLDEAGRPAGQAATFSAWTRLGD